MRALALTGLLLLVYSASEGQEAGAKDNGPPLDKTVTALPIDDSNVQTTEGSLPASPGQPLSPSQTVDENDKTNSTSNGNDTSSSVQSTSLPTTSTLSTVATPDTALNITDYNATSAQSYSTSAPTGSSNETDYVANPDGSDNTDNIPQTTDTDGGGATKKEASIELYIVLPVVAAAVVLVFVLCTVLLFLHKDRLCRKKQRENIRQQEPEAVDCDQDLYSTVNYRHHGARADNNTLGRDTKLLTKMESEEDCLTDNSLDLDDKLESGRYVSPEGLVYVTLEPTLEGENKKPAPKKNQQKKKKKKENKEPQYATLDFDKTGKLILKTDDKKSKKTKKKK